MDVLILCLFVVGIFLFAFCGIRFDRFVNRMFFKYFDKNTNIIIMAERDGLKYNVYWKVEPSQCGRLTNMLINKWMPIVVIDKLDYRKYETLRIWERDFESYKKRFKTIGDIEDYVNEHNNNIIREYNEFHEKDILV